MGGSSSTPIIPAYCNAGGYSRAFNLQELQNLPVGATREMNKGCGANIGGQAGGSGYAYLKSKGFDWPQNGEFDWGGLGSSCSMCSLDYGCDNCSGGYAVSGRRGTVKRTGYNGDQTACCTLQPSDGLYNGNTCDPKYSSSNYGNKACDSTMQGFCAQGSNIVTNSNCVTWRNAVGTGNNAANDAMKAYCGTGDNITNTSCQGWLNNDRSNQQAWYDTKVAAYCAAHPEEKSFCACFNLGDEFKSGPLSAGAAKPSCYVPACSSGTNAYRTATMQKDATTCAPIAVCNQVLNAKMSNSEIAALNQTCNIYTQAETTAAAKNNSTSGNSAAGSNSANTTKITSTNNTEIYYIVGGVVAVCLLLSSVGAIGYKTIAN